MCVGDPVELEAVDSLKFMIETKGDGDLRFCMTPLEATTEEPPRLTDPVLPQGPITDEMGQSLIRRWPGRSRSVAEVTDRLHNQLAEADRTRLPGGLSRWGGWKARRFDATGYFRTHHDGNRWWLVDPDGFAFWSMGVDCVRSRIHSYLTGIRQAYEWLPEEDGEFSPALTRADADGTEAEFADFLRVNLIRAFGADWHEAWACIALSKLREFGFNTVANWSEWEVARAAGVPYVRPLSPNAGFEDFPLVFRDFPDVFDASFPEACSAYARQLEETRGDPAMIGYFLMNEPNWGFAEMTPAEGVLRNYPSGPGRDALVDWLRDRYTDNADLASAWRMEVDFDRLAAGPCEGNFTERAREDLQNFSARMVERLFAGLSEACREVDPDHLNLGARYYTVPPGWMAQAMQHFDVFSINGYKDRFPSDLITELHELVQVPVMIGEWHFGALDAGLPGGCVRRVGSQADRGKAYRVYAEGALDHPACVGAHWFTLYDESPMGRFDGENWNTGFLDVTHRPYEELAEAARRTHEQMYEVAAGKVEPYDARVDYRRTNIL
jgi:hypothetical protein